MKYIRTYDTREKFLADKDSTSRGFRLKPTLYKYSDVGVESKILLELDDPRKHEGSTYMEITLSSDTEFSFYIGNAPDDTQTTMTCTVDWGDDTIETKTVDVDDKGFKLAHNYKAGSYKIELYDVERDYSVIGDIKSKKSLISHPSSVKRVVLGEEVVSIDQDTFAHCASLTSINISERVTSIGSEALRGCRSLKSVYIPEGVTSISPLTLFSCGSLKSVYIPEGVTIIGGNAISICASLTSICIPKSVTSMGYGAFHDTSLISISSLNTTAPIIGDSVFENIPTNGTLHIKPGATGYDVWLSALPSGWTIVEDL